MERCHGVGPEMRGSYGRITGVLAYPLVCRLACRLAYFGLECRDWQCTCCFSTT